LDDAQITSLAGFGPGSPPARQRLSGILLRERSRADMSWFRPRGWLDVTFEASIVVKGLDGILELAGGLLLLLVTSAGLNRVVAQVTQHELSEDPHDFLANRLLHVGSGLTESTVRFAAVYLLLHGIVKVALVAALLRNK
jgi:uncharacterized membrane protein